MKRYISEYRAMYEDENHGLFSRKLAEWAVGNMKVKDAATKQIKPLKAVGIEQMKEVLRLNNVQLPESFLYTAWYLYNMTYADYPRTITTDSQRATFVEETLCDPDCCPEAVLECFVTKMCLMRVPIYWELYL